MKKLGICFLSLLLTAPVFAQQTNPAQPLTRQDYLQKSKNQKKAAWILLGGGTALIVTGLLTGNKDEASFDEASTGAIFGIAGGVCAAISIPLFIASGRNKKKAAATTSYFEFRKENFTVPSIFAFRTFPALAIKFTL
jgi:uncharacterized membrane protein YfcA